MEKETHDFKFDVGSSPKVLVKNIRGKVEIKQGKDKEIKIQVIKYPDTGNAEETHFIVEQESDNAVIAKVNFESSEFFRIRKPCKIEFLLEVPADCVVRVKNVSGDIYLEKVSGNHRLKNVSGSIVFSDVKSEEFMAKSVSGSVKGINLECACADIGTVSGSVKLSGMEVEELDVSTVSGSIKFEGGLGDGRHDLGTVSGSISLKIPEDTNLDIKASSISGRLKSDMNIKFTTISRKRWIGQINKGGSIMKLKTVSGSMNVNSL